MKWVKRYEELRRELNMTDAINKLVEEVKTESPVQKDEAREAVDVDKLALEFAIKIQTKEGTVSRLNAIEWFKAGYAAKK